MGCGLALGGKGQSWPSMGFGKGPALPFPLSPVLSWEEKGDALYERLFFMEW